MLVTAKIADYDGERLTLLPDFPVTEELIRKKAQRVEIRIVDGREITADQRKKIFATIRDIAVWSGHEPEEIRGRLTWDFCLSQDGMDPFSLSGVDRTVAGAFIGYLIKFCLSWDVPTKAPLMEYCEDVEHYLWHCLYYRKCAVCGQAAEVHHVDRIGMGRDRERIVHEGLKAVALCRRHHDKAHSDQKRLFEQYHIHGIPLDKRLCARLRLQKEDGA